MQRSASGLRTQATVPALAPSCLAAPQPLASLIQAMFAILMAGYHQLRDTHHLGMLHLMQAWLRCGLVVGLAMPFTVTSQWCLTSKPVPETA